MTFGITVIGARKAFAQIAENLRKYSNDSASNDAALKVELNNGIIEINVGEKQQ